MEANTQPDRCYLCELPFTTIDELYGRIRVMVRLDTFERVYFHGPCREKVVARDDEAVAAVEARGLKNVGLVPVSMPSLPPTR